MMRIVIQNTLEGKFMLTQIGNYIHQDSKISAKLGALGLGFGLISFAITYFYPAGFWLSGFLNVLTFIAWGCMGITWAVRQEISGFISINGTLAKVLGIVMTVVCFIVAIGLLGITVRYLFGGSI
jgi:hypothetical protein